MSAPTFPEIVEVQAARWAKEYGLEPWEVFETMEDVINSNREDIDYDGDPPPGYRVQVHAMVTDATGYVKEAFRTASVVPERQHTIRTLISLAGDAALDIDEQMRGSSDKTS